MDVGSAGIAYEANVQNKVANNRGEENGARAPHHDTHAIPPRFVQEAYYHYNKVKISEMSSDSRILDFHRGLTENQKAVIRPAGVLKADQIADACAAYHDSCSIRSTKQQIRETFSDITFYEHLDFPGLFVYPDILSPKTQSLFLSQIMHDSLSNPLHKTNLETEFDIDFSADVDDKPTRSYRGQPKASLFSYAPTETHATLKGSSKPSNMAQMLSKKLRWLTIGDQYDWPTRSYTAGGPTAFPSNLQKLFSTIFPLIRPESGVCLLYGSKDYMPVHRDVSEQCETPLASFSLGCDGLFVVARGEEDLDYSKPDSYLEAEREKRIVTIRVHSGDCVVMSGETRWAWHAMPRTLTGTCPTYLSTWPLGTGKTREEDKAFEKWKNFMATKRLNVSCRQVWD